jgi:hypothetical protein
MVSGGAISLPDQAVEFLDQAKAVSLITERIVWDTLRVQY